MLFEPRIERQNQVLRVAIRLTGTPFALHYRSDRVPGRRAARRLKIPLSGRSVPRGLKGIALEVHVAGQRFSQSFPPNPEQTFDFVWTGRDPAGRPVLGRQLARVRIGYVHHAASPRPELTRWREWTHALGTWDASGLGLGGWTLTVHHAYDPVGRVLYLGDGRRLSPRGLEGGNGGARGEIAIPAEDSRELYVFDPVGRHLRTVHALTGSLLYRFEYDAAGRLTALVDGDRNATRIEHGADGAPAALVTFSGQRTSLHTTAEGYLSSVINPAGVAVQLGYAAEGLLARINAPEGADYRMTYDELGRLLQLQGPAGGVTRLARAPTDSGFRIAHITPTEREFDYLVERLPAGGERRVNRCCGGIQTVTLVGADGSRTISYSDGMVTRVEKIGAAGTRAALTSPGGLTRTVTRAHAVTLRDSRDPATVATRRDTVDVNGRVYTTTFQSAGRQRVSTSPAGRRIVNTLDAQGRVVEERIGELLPIRFAYDERGRLTGVTRGADADARAWILGYDDQGRIAALTDPLGRTTRFQYDAAGQVTRRALPDGREIAYTHDMAGNRRSLTPPGRPPHQFERTAAGFIESYLPPALGEAGARTHYAYDADGRLTRITRADGAIVTFEYDAAGAPSAVAFPGGALRLAYDPETRNLVSATAADGSRVTFSYDGSLMTRATWAGDVSGNVSFTYDQDFRVATRAVNAGEATRYQYDPDGRLTQAGALGLARDARTGFVTGTRLGDLTTTQEYNGFGELAALRAVFKDREILAIGYTRDRLGRVVEKTETIDGRADRRAYEYDAAGRLAAVTRNGVGAARYDYDPNGNRVARRDPSGTLTGTYDAQDRLLQYGDATYDHTPNGERSSKSVHGQITAYEYDVFGNLKTIRRSDGARIEYLVDGQHRRTGKRVNGALTQGFLYQDRLRPAAELDARNQVVSQFVYAAGVNVPGYMVRGGATYRIVTDHLGSPRLVVDVRSGEVVQRIDYDEDGNVVLDTNPGFQPFGFAGGLYDGDTGLLRFGARDYDPATGRWTAKDPVLFAGRSTNLYSYAAADPVNLSDPLGLTWTGIWPGSGRGMPWMDWHYNRNAGMNCPPTSPDPYSGRPECPEELESTGWHQQPNRSAEHGNNWSFRHDSGWQCIYDDNGNLVDDRENGGSFDYFPPEFNPDGSPDFTSPNTWLHGVYDWLPWILWGN